MESVMGVAYSLLDRGTIPDVALRPIIRSLCRERLGKITRGTTQERHERKMEYIAKLKAREVIADKTAEANEQHYEVSTEFMLSTLGKRAKYSSSIYPSASSTLDEAEEYTFNQYAINAKLPVVGKEDGEGWDILDLGCGWGSLGLWLAEQYPKAKITMLSNSKTQKIYIDSKAKERGFANVEVITGDVNFHEFSSDRKFHRILSIEMFEHLKAYNKILERISTWLAPKDQCSHTGGQSLLFVHVFCHKDSPYDFEEGDGWMAQNFFSGGTMPSLDLFTYFQDHLTLKRSWYFPGSHYGRTAEAWLKIQDSHRKESLKLLGDDAVAKGSTREEGIKTFWRFRVFYLAVAEFFALDGGEQWGVGWYLFEGK